MFDPTGPTYAEARQWIVWLQVFTPSDLADSMAVNTEVARRFIRAALWHGIIEDTGDSINGVGPSENIFSYVPLPPGPREHFTRPPEWSPAATPGCYDLAPRRGLPVRLIDNTSRRNAMQGTGGARVRIRQRDKAYEAMEAAKEERRQKQLEKRRAAAEDPKGKRKRDSSLPT